MTPEQFERLEALFEEASGQAPAERAAFLDERCDDPVVRAQLDAMLAVDDESHGNGSSPLEPPTRSLWIPDRIGHYRVLSECGRGGMGIVFEAEQQSPKRKVALKVIRTGLVSPQMLRRFRNEAEVLGRLQHPGIAQVFEAGSFELDGSGRPFIAMEFVEGSSLLTYAKEQELGQKERLALFAKICDAVHYAHQKGVIHRDLKPENILVVPPSTTAADRPRETQAGGVADQVGQPKILDFGIARMTDFDVQMTTMRTDPDQLIGTLQYMSPEQTSGGSIELDARSDVYALGVVLFELLSDRLPYDLREQSLPDSLLAIRDEEAQQLSAIDHRFRGDVETIVGKCLEKERPRRYATAAELAEDIRRHLADEPITARPPSTWYQLQKFARRNRALVGGIAATVLTLVIGLIATTIFALRAGENARRATDNERRAIESEGRALQQAYTARLAAASALADTNPHVARELLDKAPESLRGWEWRHLQCRLERQARVYEADAASTGPIAYSPDGERLVSALVDGRIAVWDTKSGELVRVGTALAGAKITALDVPREGPTLIACGTEDGRVRVWDLGTDRWLELQGEGDRIVEIVWDPAGERLLFSSLSALHLWRPGHPTRQHPLEVTGFATPPRRLGFAPDGTWYTASTLTLSGGDRYRFDSKTGERLPETGDIWAPLPVRAHGISSDATRFAIVQGDGVRSIVLTDAATGETQVILRGHSSFVGQAAWTPDDSRLVSSSEDGTVRLWDTSTGAELMALSGDVHSALAVPPDGTGVAYRVDGTVRFWDFAMSPSAVLQPDVSYVYLLTYAPDGRYLAASSIGYADRVALIDPHAGRVVKQVYTEAQGALAFSEDGLSLYVLDGWSAHRELGDTLRRGKMLAWRKKIDVATGEVAGNPDDVRMPSEPTLTPTCLHQRGARYAPGWTLSADGTLQATAEDFHSGTPVIVRDVATGEVVLEIEGSFHGVALSPDGKLLAAGHTLPSGHVEIWSLPEKRKLLDLPPHGTHTYGVDFHPDGTRLATGGADNAIRIWDTTTWEAVLELRGHTSYVKTLQFSPDGTQLASGSGDLTVRIWDTIPRAERHRRSRSK